MKLYLSSYGLGEHSIKLRNMFGENKKIAVIANAIDNNGEERSKKVQKEIDDLKTLGLQPVEVDLRNYFGKKDDLKKAIEEFAGVWVRGGNTFILTRAYSYSGFDELLKEKLPDKNFVYAGYSAGICVLSPTLKGLDIVDDPHIIPKKYKPHIIWEGLGFVNYAIEPHYRSNHPESSDIEKEVQYCIDNKILFIALRDGEVIISNVEKLPNMQ